MRSEDESRFQRLTLLVGDEALERLAQTSVLVFGLGGVGSWCAEALVRSGIGKIGIVDFDTVSSSNINRQIQATSRTIGLSKAEVMKERLLEINEKCDVTAWDKVFSRKNAVEFGIEKANYVIDAIDSLQNKLDLIEITCTSGIPLFSSMGMAKKIDPTRIKIAGIWETHGCPLAKNVREGLRKRNFQGSFTTVYSDEVLPRLEESVSDDSAAIKGSATVKGSAPIKGSAAMHGSLVTVTACAGMVLANLVLRDIIEK